jgi:hypothetical protein
MITRFSFAALVWMGILVLQSPAEKVDMSPEELRQTATHVVTGKVKAIYERTSTSGNYRYTHYVAEVQVAASEKGDGIKPGDLVYARYWHRRWIGRGQPEPNTSGHRGLPKVDETLRIYLSRNAYDGFSRDNQDGGFNVIGANGFEQLPQARKP